MSPQEPAGEPYRCGLCGKYFLRGNVSCCVMHPRGECCHYGDREVTPTRDDRRRTKHDARSEIARLTAELEAARGMLRELENCMYSQTQKMAGLGPVACDHCDAVFEGAVTAEGHDHDCIVGMVRRALISHEAPTAHEGAPSEAERASWDHCKAPGCDGQLKYEDDEYGSLRDGGSYEIYVCKKCGSRGNWDHKLSPFVKFPVAVEKVEKVAVAEPPVIIKVKKNAPVKG